MHLELTAPEAALLSDVLQGRLGEYSEQIASADESSFRERLRGEREVLQAIFARLTAA